MEKCPNKCGYKTKRHASLGTHVYWCDKRRTKKDKPTVKRARIDRRPSNGNGHELVTILEKERQKLFERGRAIGDLIKQLI